MRDFFEEELLLLDKLAMFGSHLVLVSYQKVLFY